MQIIVRLNVFPSIVCTGNTASMNILDQIGKNTLDCGEKTAKLLETIIMEITKITSDHISGKDMRNCVQRVLECNTMLRKKMHAEGKNETLSELLSEMNNICINTHSTNDGGMLMRTGKNF